MHKLQLVENNAKSVTIGQDQMSTTLSYSILLIKSQMQQVSAQHASLCRTDEGTNFTHNYKKEACMLKKKCRSNQDLI